MKHLLVALALCASGTASAQSACDTPKNDFDGLYCLNKVWQEADKELNANYKKLSALVDANGRAALKDSQLLWIKDRNERCSKREERGFFVNLDCATETTIKRSQALQDRIRVHELRLPRQQAVTHRVERAAGPQATTARARALPRGSSAGDPRSASAAWAMGSRVRQA